MVILVYDNIVTIFRYHLSKSSNRYEEVTKGTLLGKGAMAKIKKPYLPRMATLLLFQDSPTQGLHGG